MPFWGLVITGSSFFVPAIFAMKRKKVPDAIVGTCLALTSVMFHSTGNPHILKVDMTLAHGAAAISMIRATLKWIRRKQRIDAVGVLLTPCFAATFYYITKGRSTAFARVCHMGIHITASSYWMAYIL